MFLKELLATPNWLMSIESTKCKNNIIYVVHILNKLYMYVYSKTPYIILFFLDFFCLFVLKHIHFLYKYFNKMFIYLDEEIITFFVSFVFVLLRHIIAMPQSHVIMLPLLLLYFIYLFNTFLIYFHSLLCH